MALVISMIFFAVGENPGVEEERAHSVSHLNNVKKLG